MDRDDSAPRRSEPMELEEIAEQPGTYFNPRTELTVVVDDSGSIDQAALPPTGEGADWIRISEEPAVDEQLRDELLDRFESGTHDRRDVDSDLEAPDFDDDFDDDDEEPPGFDPELDE